MNIPKSAPPSPSFILALAVISLSGCVSDSVDYRLADHAYYKYAMKVMGKKGSNEIADGRHFEFYPNGKTRFAYATKDGKLNGVATTWDEDGLITSRVLYKDDAIVKDLLAEAQENGDGIYRVQLAADRPGVEKLDTKMDPQKAAAAVQDITSDITTNAVQQVDVTTSGAVKPITSRKGSAVKKLSRNKPVF